jgi:hypothetical protein
MTKHIAPSTVTDQVGTAQGPSAPVGQDHQPPDRPARPRPSSRATGSVSEPTSGGEALRQQLCGRCPSLGQRFKSRAATPVEVLAYRPAAISVVVCAAVLVLQSRLWLVSAGPVVAVAGALLVASSPG